MKRKFSVVNLTLFLATVLVLSAGLAHGKGGGGGVPSPFAAAANHRVELADQELYLLEGSVSFDDLGQAVFWVDLKKEPWLANKERIQNPFYRLVGTREQWNQYAGRTIIFACIAKGVVVGESYHIELVPADDDLQNSVSEESISSKHHGSDSSY
jgi:hypothetical protein